ncbi:MAG: 30S ribosomal protein S20 [Bacilli bacterium]|nr:30S ribosomal protein S20 [Bacilli bacterium]
MPNIKSAKKSVKTNKEIAIGNTVYTSRIKNSIKKIEKAVKDKNRILATTELKTTISNIDKGVSKGIIKQNSADRKKARLNKIVKEM